MPRHRRGLRHSRRRAALLQRLRPRPGAVEPVHGRRGDLRVAPAQRAPAGRLRGRHPVARLHARVRHRARASCSRSSPTAPRGTRSTSAPARRRPSSRSRAVIADGLGLDIEPEYNQQYRAGDIRHCFADIDARASELLGFEAQVPFEDGMARPARLARGSARRRPRRRRDERAGRPRPDQVGSADDAPEDRQRTWRSSSSRRTRRTGSSRACARSSSTPATRASTSSSSTTTRPTARASSSRRSSPRRASSSPRTAASPTPTTAAR